MDHSKDPKVSKVVDGVDDDLVLEKKPELAPMEKKIAVTGFHIITINDITRSVLKKIVQNNPTLD